MSTQEPEQWQSSSQDSQEPQSASFGRYNSTPLGSLDRQGGNIFQAQPAAPPAAPMGNIIALGIVKIVLSAGGMALSIVGLVQGILTLALKHAAAPGIILIVLSALGILACMAALVFSIISLVLQLIRLQGGPRRLRTLR